MIEFRAERPIWSDAVELYAKRTSGGKVYAVTCHGLKVEEVQPNTALLWPRFLELPMTSDAGQSLFDALWAAGYRPNKGESSVAHVEAMRQHLDDMRRLVFKARSPFAASTPHKGE